MIPTGCSFLAPDSAHFTGGPLDASADVFGDVRSEVSAEVGDGALNVDGIVDGETSGEDAGPCTDQVLNGDESDVDCGGLVCPTRCAAGRACKRPEDCTSANCLNGVCGGPIDTCNDQTLAPTEADVDCGGSCTNVRRCALGKHCNAVTDCVEGTCKSNICTELCSDQQKDGDETDIDCGGARCPRCKLDQVCIRSVDCATNVCLDGVCKEPSCHDRILNQSETDIDCGGSCPNRCALQAACLVSSDCDSFVCGANRCVADQVVPFADVVDDMEDGNTSIAALGGREGDWYTFSDGTGTCTYSNALIPGGRGTQSTKAMHFTGAKLITWGGGGGLDLNNPERQATTKKLFDASKYSGFTFWARSDVPMAITVLAPDKNTTPNLGVCGITGGPACDDHLASSVQLTAEWKRHHVTFSAMRTNSVPAQRLDKASLVGFQFRLGANQDFDFWIDDVAFEP